MGEAGLVSIMGPRAWLIVVFLRFIHTFELDVKVVKGHLS